MSQILYITNILLDFGVVQRLRDECERVGMARPLIVTDPGIRAAGLLDRVLAQLPPPPPPAGALAKPASVGAAPLPPDAGPRKPSPDDETDETP